MPLRFCNEILSESPTHNPLVLFKEIIGSGKSVILNSVSFWQPFESITVSLYSPESERFKLLMVNEAEVEITESFLTH